MRFLIGNSLKKLFQLTFVLLGCLHLVGGPYSLMQAYAWAGMLVTYSQDEGLFQAAKDTFSGEKPCELCHKIKSARADDRGDKQPVAPLHSTASSKLLQEMLPCADPFLAAPLPRDFSLPGFPASAPLADLHSPAPPTPPPCQAAA